MYSRVIPRPSFNPAARYAGRLSIAGARYCHALQFTRKPRSSSFISLGRTLGSCPFTHVQPRFDFVSSLPALCTIMIQLYAQLQSLKSVSRWLTSHQVLELEKFRNLHNIQHKTSTPHSHAPGWNEALASASEAAVKVRPYLASPRVSTEASLQG